PSRCFEYRLTSSRRRVTEGGFSPRTSVRTEPRPSNTARVRPDLALFGSTGLPRQAVEPIAVLFLDARHALLLLGLDVLLRLGRFRLQRVYLGVSLPLDGFAPRFGFLQFLLQLRTQCVHAALELRLALCPGLGVLGFRLGHVCLDRCDVSL